ncbi:MAG: DUF3459 domain-containing protein [Anaerolineales bacterium]|nr:DUF3459 domain-containing protein [Anaerolineales bacterium]
MNPVNDDPTLGIASAPGDLPMPMLLERQARRASQFRHDNTVQPSAPLPDEPVTISATSGAALPIDRAELWYTVDGSQPGPASQRLSMPLAQVLWEPRVGYLNEWAVTVPPQPAGTIVRYQIAGYRLGADRPEWLAHDGTGFWYRYGADGITTFAYRVRAERQDLPDWMQDAVIYHIFLDRFHNGTENGVWPAGQQPLAKHGGNLQGVIQALPYLAELGVNCLWLSPLGPAESYHRYDQTSFTDIDPILGDLATMRQLVAAAHARGLRLILDYVPSHASWQMPAFLAAQADQKAPSASWFIFEQWPDKYRSFLGIIPQLVSLNTNDPGLRRFLIDSARYWLCDVGFDGLRLDHSIGHGLDFWVQFCTELETVKPAVALFGEATDTPENLQRQAGRLQGVLDFPLAEALRLTFGLGRWGVTELAGFLRSHFALMAHGPGLVGFFDNHDMDRLLFLAENDSRRLRLAALALLTLPGPITLYYGTEIGLSQPASKAAGGFGGDHVVRGNMVWDPAGWDHSLLTFFRDLIALRRQSAALRRGHWSLRQLDDQRQLLVYEMAQGAEKLAIWFNLGDEPVNGPDMSPLLTTTGDWTGALPPLSGAVFGQDSG